MATINELTALAIVEAAAEQGDSMAQFELGDRYHQGNEMAYPGRCYARMGNGVKKNRLLALKWWNEALRNPIWKEGADSWRRAAQSRIDNLLHEIIEYRNVDELKALGKIYLYGSYDSELLRKQQLGIPKDRSKARDCFVFAAELGDVEAQMEIANLHQSEIHNHALNLANVDSKDLSESLKWYQAIVDNPIANSEQLERAKNGIAWINYYIDEQRVHLSKAAYEEGEAFRKGDNGTPNYEKAMVAYRQAVNICSAPFLQESINVQGPFYGIFSAWMVGMLYDYGQGVTKDDVQAVAWYRKAAEWGKGAPWPKVALGHKYLSGEGVKKDYAIAFDYFNQSAGESADAKVQLGWMYENGMHVTQDYNEAAKWYQKAADEGSLFAIIDLGRYYQTGSGGLPKDPQKAQQLFESVIVNSSSNDIERTRATEALKQLNNDVPQELSNGGAVTKDKLNSSSSLTKPDEVALAKVMREIHAMIGLSQVKNELEELAHFARYQIARQLMGHPATPITMHLVFAGNPGTGKTTVARYVGSVYKALGLLPSGHCVEAKREDLVGEYLGQTAPKTKKLIEQAMGGVLFIDEAYSLTPPFSHSDYGKEVIDTLVAEMENNREGLAIVVAGYTDEMQEFMKSNPGLKSRFSRWIHFADYRAEELVDIFIKFARDQGYTLHDEGRILLKAFFDRLYAARGKDFSNGRQARNVFEDTLKMLARRYANESALDKQDALHTITAFDLPAYVREPIR